MPRILAVADTDSYLKWSAATLDGLPADWSAEQLVVENPVMPSAAQIEAASHLPVEVVSAATVLERVRVERPDVVLLACTGPVVAALSERRVLCGPERPVLVTGLPGISVPASHRAVHSRARCDLFLLHSHREVAEFTVLAARVAPALRFGLAPLPFLPAAGARPPLRDPAGHLVFAAQARVPARREERLAILRALAEAGGAVVKLRALSDEQQTHRETWPYPELWSDLVAAGEADPDAVRFVGGRMRDALAGARGLVTVSSTAALEAMALGLPVLSLADFGVSAKLINLVFTGSGCLGTLADLRADRLPYPDPDWRAANYFHPAVDDDWLTRLEGLVGLRRRGLLPRPRPPRPAPLTRRVRRRVRLLLPPATWRRLRRIRRYGFRVAS